MGPNTGALAPRARPKAGLGVGCWRGSPPPALRVRGCHPQKICDNSDAKSCILVTTFCEISCFKKTMAKKLGTNTLLVGFGPQPKSWGTSLPRSLRLLRLCLETKFWRSSGVRIRTTDPHRIRLGGGLHSRYSRFCCCCYHCYYYEVSLRRARLVLGWVTVTGFNSRCVTFISVCH